MTKRMKLMLSNWSSEQLANLEKLLKNKRNKDKEPHSLTLSRTSLLIKVDSARKRIELTTNTVDKFGIKAVFCIQIEMHRSDNVQDITVCCNGAEFINFLNKCKKISQPPHAIVSFPAADEKQLLLFSIVEKTPVVHPFQKDLFDGPELEEKKQNSRLISSPEHTTPLHPQAVIAEFSHIEKYQEAHAKIDSQAFVRNFSHVLSSSKGNINNIKNSTNHPLQLEITNNDRCVIYAKSGSSIGSAIFPLLPATEGLHRLNAKLCSIPITFAKKLKEVLSKESLNCFIEMRARHLLLYQGELTLCVNIEKNEYPKNHFQDQFIAPGDKNKPRLNVDDLVAFFERISVSNGKHDVIHFTAIKEKNIPNAAKTEAIQTLCEVDFGYASNANVKISGESHNRIKTTTPFEEGETYSFNLSQFQNAISALQNEPKAINEWYFNQKNSGLVLRQYYENSPRDRQAYMLVLIHD